MSIHELFFFPNENNPRSPPLPLIIYLIVSVSSDLMISKHVLETIESTITTNDQKKKKENR